jgi:ABC-2 type transport system ATP-binding protein/nitrous oxidase accessory protein
MIKIQNLTKRYSGTPVLQDVSLEIAPGESIALWGPNGAGKTTIVLCLLGFLQFDGDIHVDGKDVRRDGKEIRSLIGYVPQQPGFYDDLTVAETLGFSAQLRSIGTARAEEVLNLVDLGEHRDKAVGALSGGLRQRLGLGVALLPDPSILLLDEPTSNLDAATRQATVNLLEKLRSDGRIMIVTSHHFEEVSMLVDRVVVLDNGLIVDQCAPAELGERLGIRSWLHVLLEPDDVESAMEALAAAGFGAHLNGRGVLVEVAPTDKAKAVAAISQVGIEIRDLEVWR